MQGDGTAAFCTRAQRLLWVQRRTCLPVLMNAEATSAMAQFYHFYALNSRERAVSPCLPVAPGATERAPASEGSHIRPHMPRRLRL